MFFLKIGLAPTTQFYRPYLSPRKNKSPVVRSPINMATQLLALGPDPAPFTCPHCNANVITTVKAAANTKTHLLAFILCISLCIPCVCIPYCCNSCQTLQHYCPNCKAYLGAYVN
ncbi:unnamed protein product [Acanthoscelides obtectus]|uniref:LITAF domain-containing protein n=1 Tax=Acanthoscelides obtectus TaxID=200917 RepID=A0A9P0K9A3_ACAOB|nr:unnamed protein product [Acanthoscelides obtectus]CAK1622890.1 Lipopolysaccharide-induced tumor necrosis factor-alpha factor homolog [Acanthoscelides obtectus]